MDLRAYLKLSPVVPVLTIHRVEDADAFVETPEELLGVL